MSPNRNLFINFSEVNTGKVLMENNSICKITRKCAIKLMVHGWVVKTLIDVRYISELKRNLISFRVLDLASYCYIVQNGKLKVSKGLLVVMKAEMKNGLYLLASSAIDSIRAVSSPKFQDKGTFWDMRLAHVN